MKVYSHTLEPQRKIAVFFFFHCKFHGLSFQTKYIYFPKDENKSQLFFMCLHCRQSTWAANHFVGTAPNRHNPLLQVCGAIPQALLENSMINTSHSVWMSLGGIYPASFSANCVKRMSRLLWLGIIPASEGFQKRP